MQSAARSERWGGCCACVHPQTRLTFAQQQQRGVTSPGSEVCAVRTVEMKAGTAEQNVLKLINSTWLESQVPIYNITPLLLYLVRIPGSKHASIMKNIPKRDVSTGHQSGQENKHANTHIHTPPSDHSTAEEGEDWHRDGWWIGWGTSA